MLSNAQVNYPSVPVVNKRVKEAVLDPAFKTAQHAENVLRNQSDTTAVKNLMYSYSLQSIIPQLLKDPQL